MKSPSLIFDDAARRRINAAVAAAESRTSVEIVPVVASVSGRYDRSEDLAGLFVGVLAMIGAWAIFQRIDPALDGWDEPNVVLGITELVIILVIGFVIGAVVTSHVGWIRRLFTPRREMSAEVNSRAREAFFDLRTHHTRAGTGVLLLVSLFERTAVVVADETVIDRLGMPEIENLCTQLTGELRNGDVVTALEAAIAVVGDKLAAALPREAGDVNELPDALVTVD